MCHDEQTLRQEKVFISKLNLTLVEILKQEWPHNWPSFISDLVGSSKSSEVPCENNMQILKLLSEKSLTFKRSVGYRESQTDERKLEWRVLLDIPALRIRFGTFTATITAPCHLTNASMILNMDLARVHLPDQSH